VQADYEAAMEQIMERLSLTEVVSHPHLREVQL
jgi:hypothetical protein